MILPMYIDVSAFIIGAISKRMKKVGEQEIAEDNAKVGQCFTRSTLNRVSSQGLLCIADVVFTTPEPDNNTPVLRRRYPVVGVDVL